LWFIARVAAVAIIQARVMALSGWAMAVPIVDYRYSGPNGRNLQRLASA
jgi:hypothetical protein